MEMETETETKAAGVRQYRLLYPELYPGGNAPIQPRCRPVLQRSVLQRRCHGVCVQRALPPKVLGGNKFVFEGSSAIFGAFTRLEITFRISRPWRPRPRSF